MNLLSTIDARRGRTGSTLATTLWLAAAVLVIATAGPATAATWHVAPGGHDLNPGSPGAPFASIQRAINMADPGDLVLLADGTYQGIGNRQVTFLGKAITVRSASGRREDCVVRAQGFDGFVFQMGETATSVLADVTITGADQGVAIFGASTRPHLANCVVDSCTTGVDVSHGSVAMTDCVVSRSGTGILIRDDGSNIVITGTRVTGNSGPGVATTGFWTCFGSRGLQLLECKLVDNRGPGLQHFANFGGAYLQDCDVADNDGWGLLSSCPGDYGLYVSGGSVRGNGEGGINNSSSNWDSVADCEIEGNRGPGILSSWDASNRIRDCVIRDNAGHGISFGGGPLLRTKVVADKDWATVTVSGCTIHDNGGCGIDYSCLSPNQNVFSDCLVYHNAGPGLRITAPFDPYADTHIVLLASTIVGNAHGLQLSSDLPISVERTLIAFNDGAAVDCTTQPQVTLTCSDLCGNPGGDWTGPIAPQAGIAGNFAADPRFVDATSGDYRLLDISPCAPGHAGACGRIGGLDVGAWATPRLLALTDVGGDQGGQLRLQWAASYFDRPGAAQPVTGYGVYRRQGAAATHAGADTATPRADKLLGWDFVAMVPSRGDTGYQIVAPTLVDAPAPGDSTGAWSVFMVSAMTADPLTFHDSAPDSGVSRDNLAPATPMALHMEGVRRLVWDDCHDADFTRFAIYGSLTGARDGTEVPLGQTTATTFNVRDLVYPYFLVVAVDRHANGSAPALWAPAAGADDTPAAASLALRPCHPNPFNPSTTLSFTLPQGGPARVAVYDVAGRAVRTLIDTTLGAGAHDATWDGRNDAGRAVSAGGYVARLEFGAQTRSVRMTLVK
jgi:hypothetical protein